MKEGFSINFANIASIIRVIYGAILVTCCLVAQRFPIKSAILGETLRHRLSKTTRNDFILRGLSWSLKY